MIDQSRITQARKSLESTLRKLEASKQSILSRNRSATYVNKQIAIMKECLVYLDLYENKETIILSSEKNMELKKSLTHLLDELSLMKNKFNIRSSQHTLLVRRMDASHLILEIIEPTKS